MSWAFSPFDWCKGPIDRGFPGRISRKLAHALRAYESKSVAVLKNGVAFFRSAMVEQITEYCIGSAKGAIPESPIEL
jgi:hypothetical protein